MPQPPSLREWPSPLLSTAGGWVSLSPPSPVPGGTCGRGRDTSVTDQAGQGGRSGKGKVAVCGEDEHRVRGRSDICDEP